MREKKDVDVDGAGMVVNDRPGGGRSTRRERKVGT